MWVLCKVVESYIATKVVNAADHEASSLYACSEASGTPQVVVLILVKTLLPSVGGVVAKLVTEARLVQPSKAPLPILVIPLGSSIEARLVQPTKELSPILVIPLGSSIEARLVHS